MRQYVSHKEPDKNGLLHITGQDFKYLKNVLRIAPGDMLPVRLPDGSLINSTVSKINKDSRLIILQICSENKSGADTDSSREINRGVQASTIEGENSGVDYYLFQVIAKPVKMEMIIRQAVECGVKYIVPVIGEYSQKSSVQALQGGKSDRFERIIKEARQQSGSPVETVVKEPVTLQAALEFWKAETADCFAEENKPCGEVAGDEASAESSVCAEPENVSLTEKKPCAVAFSLWERSEKSVRMDKIIRGKNIQKAALCVGCEGGISPSEIEELYEGGFLPVHFEGNILRCETASLYGIAALQTNIRNEKE